MVERKQLTDEMVELWRTGCALLDAMTRREYSDGESDRYYQFRDIDKRLTWPLVGPHSCSLFSAHLDGPPDLWTSPQYGMYIDWPVAQTWRKALIEASGVVPRKFEVF
jgi:hypothetical protein